MTENSCISSSRSEFFLPVIDLSFASTYAVAAYVFAKIRNKVLSDRIKFANTCSGNVIQKYGAKLDDQDYGKLLERL